MSCILDASTLLKSAVDERNEEGAEAARAIQPPLAEKFGFRAPDLIAWEVASVVLHERQDEDRVPLEDRVRDFDVLLSGIETVPSRGIDWELTGRLSGTYGLTACDASYLALATVEPNSLLLTEDGSLLEAARSELSVDRAHDAVSAFRYIQDGLL